MTLVARAEDGARRVRVGVREGLGVRARWSAGLVLVPVGYGEARDGVLDELGESLLRRPVEPPRRRRRRYPELVFHKEGGRGPGAAGELEGVSAGTQRARAAA